MKNNRLEKLGLNLGKELDTNPESYKTPVDKILENNKSGQQRKMYDPNYRNETHKPHNNRHKPKNTSYSDPHKKNQDGEHFNKDKNYTGGINMENLLLENNLGSAFGVTYALQSSEYLDKYRKAIEKHLPEFAKCITKMAIAPHTHATKDPNSGFVDKQETAKIVIKADLTKSNVLWGRGAEEKIAPDMDPIYAAMINSIDGKGDAKSDLPKYLKERGNGILFNEFYDVISVKSFMYSNGQVFDQFKTIEVIVDATILKTAGLDEKLYTAQVASQGGCKRLKDLEETLKQNFRSQNKNVNIPEMYLLRLFIDVNNELTRVSRLFKQSKNNKRKGNGGSNAAAAAAAFARS
ncbi:MAG: hypothetical protein ACRC7S_04965 [Cetobacterium sp.]